MLMAGLPIYGFEQTFSFDLTDFIIQNQNGVVQITSKNRAYVAGYNEAGDPEMPFFRYQFTANRPFDPSTLKCEILSRSLVSTNVEIKRCEPLVPMGAESDSEQTSKKVKSVYPDSLLMAYNGPLYNDNRVILTMTPFYYDSTTKSLYFVSQLKVSYSDISTPRTIVEEESTRQIGEPVDYLIITEDSLADVFEEFVEWKIIKGVKTRVVTLDSIYSAIPGCSLPVNESFIKQFIKDYHREHQISMVLLGGSSSIIPGKKLTIEPPNVYPNQTISDLYYACFSEEFSRYGGISPAAVTGSDGINYHPDICVSRLPVRNRTQLATYIQKVLKYERDPEMGNDSIRMLLAGTHSNWTDSTIMMSDAQYESETMSEIIREEFPTVSTELFTNTRNTFGLTGSNSIVDANNLSNVLNTYRPHWLNMYCHGEYDRWLVDSIPFTNEFASALDNFHQPMIVTTLACYTADFSYRGWPCLAETLLFHPKGGAIAYWGSSNLGKGSYSHNLSLSTDFCLDFLKDLLIDNHYGEAVRLLRNEKADVSNADYHRLCMSMNALGDCELPIYTDLPQQFQNLNLRIAHNVVYFEDDGLNSGHVVVTSQGDYASRYYDELDVIDGYPDNVYLYGDTIPCNICIMKKNYVPFVTTTGHFVGNGENYDLFLQNACYLSNSIQYEAPDNIYVGKNIDSAIDEGDVIVEPGGTLSFTSISKNTIIQSGFRCKLGGKLIVY